jgi:hypothetical protein
MTFPVAVDYNETLNFLLDQLTTFAEALGVFMSSTEPYVLTCAPKKLFFFLLLETTIVYAFLYEARRAKYLAVTYLAFKLFALYVPVTTLHGFVLFAAWVIIFATALVDLLVVNFAFVCLA